MIRRSVASASDAGRREIPSRRIGGEANGIVPSAVDRERAWGAFPLASAPRVCAYLETLNDDGLLLLHHLDARLRKDPLRATSAIRQPSIMTVKRRPCPVSHDDLVGEAPTAAP
jgi:hypothetical protein